MLKKSNKSVKPCNTNRVTFLTIHCLGLLGFSS